MSTTEERGVRGASEDAPAERTPRPASAPALAAQPEALPDALPDALPSSSSQDERRVRLTNNTAHRVEVQVGPGCDLAIAPFATREVTMNAAIESRVRARWEQLGMLNVELIPEAPVSAFTVEGWSFGCLLPTLGLLALGLSVSFLRASWLFWGLLVMLALSVGYIAADEYRAWSKQSELLKRVGEQGIGPWMQVLNSLLVIGFVIGVNGLVVFVFGDASSLLSVAMSADAASMGALVRLMQFAFLCVASLLPVMLYFLYNRQQHDMREREFLRNVMRLEPELVTTIETREKYRALLSKHATASGSSSFLFWSGSPLLLSTLLVTMGWILVVQPFGPLSAAASMTSEIFIAARLGPTHFAFLGSYFFAVNTVFRRYVRSDLTPKTYSHIVLRLVLSFILVWVLSLFSAFEEGGRLGPELLNCVAFFVGVVPESGLALLHDLLGNRITATLFPTLQEEHPISKLDGVNLYDRARFLEEGIESVDNLAHHDLVELILSTRIPIHRLIDMFDQAALYIHLGLSAAEVEESRRRLRRYGIRTATDLEEAHRVAAARAEARPRELTEFLALLDNPEGRAGASRLQMILDVLRDDDWMSCMRCWRRFGEGTRTTYRYEDDRIVLRRDILEIESIEREDERVTVVVVEPAATNSEDMTESPEQEAADERDDAADTSQDAEDPRQEPPEHPRQEGPDHARQERRNDAAQATTSSPRQESVAAANDASLDDDRPRAPLAPVWFDPSKPPRKRTPK